MNTPTLNTRRLTLRKFNENDLEAFYDIFSDKEVNQFLPFIKKDMLLFIKRNRDTLTLFVKKTILPLVISILI